MSSNEELFKVFDVPEACYDCPAQCELVADVVLREMDYKSHFKLSGSLVGEDSKKIDKQLKDKLPEDLAEKVTTELRQEAAKTLDDLEAELETAKATSEAFARSCDGALKMRASREGIKYTVAICTSREAYSMNATKEDHAPAHIWASTE